MGTVTDIASVLRLLFSRIGKPYVGYANAFSFNDPQGMCLECNGLGRKIGIDPEALIDQSSLSTSSRSNPATYTGIMDEVRKAFAAVNNVDAGLFSFNSKGL